MNEILSVKDVLSDPMHPAHDAVADTIIDLQAGRISMCACMGPMYGEPFCPCQMRNRGLPPSQARLDDQARLEEEHARFCEYLQTELDKNKTA